jgi:hypothetical protein
MYESKHLIYLDAGYVIFCGWQAMVDLCAEMRVDGGNASSG